MIEVVVRDEQNLDDALRVFRRKLKKDGILNELKRRRHYEKPSVKRKTKSRLAKR